MSEWGPWIEHDGKGCPCVGQWVQSETQLLGVAEHIAHAQAIDGFGDVFPADEAEGDAWVWTVPDGADVTRYRIRKPRALVEMIERIESLPSQPERVEA